MIEPCGTPGQLQNPLSTWHNLDDACSMFHESSTITQHQQHAEPRKQDTSLDLNTNQDLTSVTRKTNTTQEFEFAHGTLQQRHQISKAMTATWAKNDGRFFKPHKRQHANWESSNTISGHKADTKKIYAIPHPIPHDIPRADQSQTHLPDVNVLNFKTSLKVSVIADVFCHECDGRHLCTANSMCRAADRYRTKTGWAARTMSKTLVYGKKAREA